MTDPLTRAKRADPSSPKSPRSMWGQLAAMTFALMVLFVAITVMYLGWAYWRVNLREVPFPSGQSSVNVVIEEGDASRSVLTKLQAQGVQFERIDLRLLLRAYPDALKGLQVGVYTIHQGATAKDIIATFDGGTIPDQAVRIPDGATRWDVERILNESPGLKRVAFQMKPEDLMKALGLPEYLTFEGFIAPETYRYATGSSDLTILRQAVNRQKRILDAAWAQRGDTQAKNPYELLTLASIIEKETGIHSDRHLVSSVFNNRLKVGMPLQTDPTVIYGLGPTFNGRLTKANLEAPTPYNTYRMKSLPPTPISMPTAASIEAAAQPAKTRFLYFVARGDGTSEFTTNLKDHNLAVQHFILRKEVTPLHLPHRHAKENAQGPLRAQ